MGQLSKDQRVFVRNEPGIIRFIGETQFAPGIWVGVELQNAHGKNNGTVNDVNYFECEKTNENHGVFVRLTLVGTDSLLETKSTDVLNLENIINKLQDKLRNANDEIREHKQKIELLKEEVIQHRNISLLLESKLEMVTTDKEFLEDSSTKVNQALGELQLKYDELKTDFQIMLEEVELNKQIEEEIKVQMEHSNATVSDIQTIILRNRLLEIALTSLQKLSNENESNLKNEIKELNQRLIFNKKEIGTHDELLQNISTAQVTIDSLQSQLDSALQLEKMIEHLNVENDNLTSKVSSLTKTVDELTELHELDKSLDENQALVEKDLRQDIHNLSTIIKDHESLIQELNRKNKYIESKISDVRNKTNINQEDEESLEDLQMQLEALKLEFRKAKSSNVSYKISHNMINSKLEILQQHMNLPNSSYKTILEILLSINLAISTITIINNVLKGLLEEETSYKKSVLFGINNRFSTLKFFLQNITTLWEYNYDKEKYVALAEKFHEMISDLLLEIEVSAIPLIDGDYEEINTHYINNFLLETTELINLRVSEDDEIKVFFQNASCIKFLLESFHNEANFYVLMVNILKNFLALYQTESLPLNEKLDKILSKSLKQRTEFEVFIQKLEEELKCGNNINVFIPSVPDFYSLLVTINSHVESMLSILSQIEAEYHLNNNSISIDEELIQSIFGHETIASVSKLDSLSEILDSRESFLKMQIIDMHLVLPKVYSALYSEHETLEPLSKKNIAEEELKVIKPKYTEISTTLLEKETMIQELQLNIKFLQTSMESSSIRNRDTINNMKNELKKINDENFNSNQRYIEAMKTNHKLELEIEELLGSTLISDNGKIFNNFADLQSENLFNANMVLLEEIMVLRKLVNHKQEYNKIPELNWLHQPLINTSKVGNSSGVALIFERSSANLRDISRGAKLVNLCNNPTTWRPKVNIPKYMTSLLEEKTNNYIHQRNLAFS